MDNPESILEPLLYHRELRDYLKSQERELWNWFSSAKAKAEYAEKLRLELLKTTYRLDRAGHGELYQTVDEAKARLQLDIPVTLYQAQNNPNLNAALFHMPREGHVVFSGPVFSLLNAEELKSVIGHELAHYHLWERDEGEFHIADRLIHAVANDPRAASSHEQSARRYQLYTEIFADRGSLVVSGDVKPVIASLVKLETGMSQVNAESYLKQAEEIFASGQVATEGVSHPEAFIRARAVSLWRERGAGAMDQIEQMIEGAATLEDLDVLGQKRLTARTRRLVEGLLQPRWFQTASTLGHAKLYFGDFRPVNGTDAAPCEGLKASESKLREYFCSVLLDFVRADPELEEAPLAAALEFSKRMDLEETFEKFATRDLKMKPRDIRRVKEQATEILAKAETEA